VSSYFSTSERNRLRTIAAHRKTLKKTASQRLRGLQLTAGGKYAAAGMAFRTALRLAESARPPDPIFLASLLNDFGVLCKYRGRLAEARQMYLRAIRIAGRVDEDWNREEFFATIYHNLAGIAHAKGRYAEGVKYARHGMRIRKKVRPRDAVALATDEAACAAILAEMGRYSEAVPMLLGALRVMRRRLGVRHFEVGAVLANLGATYWKMGKVDAAVRAMSQGAAILERALGKNHPRVSNAMGNLRLVRRRQASLGVTAGD
jgi:tetratricopeptide (TPR) repeat protein